MKITEYAYAIVIAVFLMMYTTTAMNCSSVKDVKWARDTVYYHRVHYPGEWAVISCTANVEENVTLWTGDRKLTVDNKKVKWASKNVFNVTNLTEEDVGIYKCKFCNEERAQKIILSLSKRGKAWEKPMLTKEPNQSLYDIGSSVRLTCSAGMLYEIKWYKLNSTESLNEFESNTFQIRRRVLDLKNMDEQNVTYKCEIIRHPLNYRSYKLVNIQLKAPQVPKIEIQSEGRKFYPLAGEDFSLSYNVTSYPDSDIEWSRSRDGVKYVNIAKCSLKGGCNKNKEINDLKEDIASTSFEIKNLEFPQDNGYYYKCNASNEYGSDSKVFQLQVYVKPEINMTALKYIFERRITINCTLKTPKVNPPVNYTWFSCDSTETCDKKSEISKTFSLQLESQSKHYMKYMCNATNAAGSDSEIIEVFTPLKPRFKMQHKDGNFYPMAGEDFSLSYNFTAYPDSNIEWWRSRDGIKYVHIASCFPKEVVGCKKSNEDLKEDITSTRFEIRNLKFPQDNGYYYKCNASNEYGNDSKVFRLHVYGNGSLEQRNLLIYTALPIVYVLLFWL